MTGASTPKDVLAIGAAGFTYPRDVSAFSGVSTIDAVDVDPNMRMFAEEHFLPEPLSSKVSFFPDSGRYFLFETIAKKKLYDIAFIDVYFGKMSIPNEFLTREFFVDVDHVVRDHHTLYNMILDTNLSSDFARRTLATLRAATGHVYYHILPRAGAPIANFIVTTYSIDGYKEYIPPTDTPIYTDDQGTYESDKIDLFQK